MRIQLGHTFKEIISTENLLEAWTEFIKGKRTKQDVLEFKEHLIDRVHSLHDELISKTYRHGPYIPFNISDPKPRNIHKAAVRDRLLHHAIHRKLYPFFDRTFIFDSYSCRKDKGTHKALARFTEFGRKVSRNNTKTCWVLKCDIRKFFASVDHDVLRGFLETYIPHKDVLWLLRNIIESFEIQPHVGLPLGNLTSQLFVNIYMNEFDHFVKHTLKARYYIRYADDFVIFSQDRKSLETVLLKMKIFLHEKLKLEMHPNKVSIKTIAAGVDFLGWVHFPQHTVLRTVSKRRMLRRIIESPKEDTVQSYRGQLQHGDTHKLQQGVENLYWILSEEE